MKRTAFNETTDVAPLPFDERVLASALRLKSLDMKWEPHVGCFVWDHKGLIQVPSPFPLDVYFILNLRRFEAILGSIDRISSELVWVPTWHQALSICKMMDIEAMAPAAIEKISTHPVEGLLDLYDRIADALKFRSHQSEEVAGG